MTPAQLATLKTLVAAEPTLAQAVLTGQDNLIAAWLNADASPAYKVWRSTTPAADINDAIIWANLTPADSPDVTVLFTNRALLCQSKQINLQILIQGRDSINSAKSSIRSGLQDGLTNVPSGIAGATAAAGWPAVKLAMTRNATRAEKALATGAGTAGAPSDLGFEGAVSVEEAGLLR